jgi:hypothetical protein
MCCVCRIISIIGNNGYPKARTAIKAPHCRCAFAANFKPQLDLSK